jgi:hypothetical protein
MLVTIAYIRSLQDVGYKGLTAAQLIALRTNNVNRDFQDVLSFPARLAFAAIHQNKNGRNYEHTGCRRHDYLQSGR